ncbi:MAG TPA: prepilin-type N-terminal cleavage/methylation domain-containing protein [Polyangiaceae bacterium]|jgi:general secretion pathway protein G
MSDLPLHLYPTQSIPRIRRHRRARGVTLIEVLIVVAILAMVSAGVGISAYRYHLEAQLRMARTNARDLRNTVKAWWLTHDSTSCPSVAQLVRDGALDKDSPPKDPWGGDWAIECAEDDVTISSKGRDRRAGTEDDIRVPPA